MKKLLILFYLLILPVFATEELKNVGIAKYAVLEVLQNNTPLRTKPDENAYRVTHLYKDTVLFADKENQEYYRVEVSENNYLWVNKKLVEVQAIIPEKRIENIDKITFKTTKKYRTVEFDTQLTTNYIIKENGNNIDFTLYDNRFDPVETKVIKNNSKIDIPNKITNEFNLVFYNNTKPFGYDVEKTDNGYLLKVKKIPRTIKRRPLTGMKVVLDAGHGGDDTGIRSFGYREKDINLQIVKKLKKEMQTRGARVYLTRKNDKYIPLYERADFAREKEADILLSIHQNSLPNPEEIEKKHGVGVYYYHEQSLPLAQKIQESLLSATKFQDDKVNFRSFVMTRPTCAISVLIECGYLIYKPEAEKLVDKKFQKIIAKAIRKGVEEYLREYF